MYTSDFDNADTCSINSLDLEEIYQKKWEAETANLMSLSKKVCNLHCSLLYHPNRKSKVGEACFDTWITLIKKVGGSPDCWRVLGQQLGISAEDLDYIKNSIKEDFTDTVLKIFIQDENATLDKIVDSFIKMKRLDILLSIEKPLCKLAQHFNKDDSKSDTGYHSNSKNSNRREIISLSEQIPNNLPPALNKHFGLSQKGPNRPNQRFRNDVQKLEKIRNDKPILFLTFAEDGFETAMKIQDKVNNWPEEFDVTVLTLNDRKEDVLPNPEKFIREYFEKADYIVPIATTGYLASIKSHKPTVSNAADNLDIKYVGFIYTLIVNHYIHMMGCFNKKVRSVLPQNADVSILADITLYPDLLPWTNEIMFDEQFKVFLKNIDSNDSV